MVVLLVILLALAKDYERLPEIERGVYIETWGTLIDILIVGVILSLFAHMLERKERIERYLEEIDDLKKLNSVESRNRIAGLLRRLQKIGKTDIDFSGLILTDFNFYTEDIHSIKGSKISLGLRLDKMRSNLTRIDNVDFSHIDCTEVVFSRSFGKIAGSGLAATDLLFTGSRLVNAIFDGANLDWTKFKIDRSEWRELIDEDELGNPISEQVYFPAFGDADLKGCSFKYTKLKCADFRDALNILDADFEGSEGLETCFFDDEVRDKILSSTGKIKE